MFDLGLGCSLDGITGVMDYQVIDMLEKSAINTFEFSPWCFFTDYDGEIRNAFVRMIERSGKKVISYHVPFKQPDDIGDPDEAIRLRAMSRLRAHLHEASRLGCRYIVVHPSTEPIDQTKRDVYSSQLRKSMREMEGELKLHNMVLALECLPRLCMGNSVEELLKMLDGFDDTFGVCLDVNHLMDKYARLPEFIRTLGKRLVTVHLCDYDGVDEKHWLPLTGVIDYQAVIRAMAEIGYTGPFNYEISIKGATAREQIDKVEANYLQLKAML